MTRKKAKEERIWALTVAELDRNPPKTQEDVCALAARVSITADPDCIPRTDTQFIDAAYGAAQGLFGPAFENADDGQRWTWIDMCERALREAMKVPPRHTGRRCVGD